MIFTRIFCIRIGTCYIDHSNTSTRAKFLRLFSLSQIPRFDSLTFSLSVSCHSTLTSILLRSTHTKYDWNFNRRCKVMRNARPTYSGQTTKLGDKIRSYMIIELVKQFKTIDVAYCSKSDRRWRPVGNRFIGICGGTFLHEYSEYKMFT